MDRLCKHSRRSNRHYSLQDRVRLEASRQILLLERPHPPLHVCLLGFCITLHPQPGSSRMDRHSIDKLLIYRISNKPCDNFGPSNFLMRFYLL